jgi:hypothetical protein
MNYDNDNTMIPGVVGVLEYKVRKLHIFEWTSV